MTGLRWFVLACIIVGLIVLLCGWGYVQLSPTH